MVEAIIGGILYGGCGALMLGIGISQMRSKKPVAFYTGEKPPKPEDISDVAAWNKKHGLMFVIYSFCFIMAWVFSLLASDNILMLIPLVLLILGPMPIIIAIHHELKKQYFIPKS